MLTVVHIITKLELGGAQENTLYTCRALDRRRFQVVLIHGPRGMLDAEAAAMPDTIDITVPELVREIRPASDAACVSALTRRLRSLHTAHVASGNPRRGFVVHTHSSKAGILGRIAARAAGVPFVVHTIHGFGFHPGQKPAVREVFVRAEQAAARLTDAFIGVSRANIAEARALGIIHDHHVVEVIRSGFDLSEFRRAGPDGARLRAELGFSADTELLVAVANMKPQKDPLTLVAAFARLAPRRPRAVLLYAGDGELRSAVEAAIAREGLKGRVHLLGWRRDVPALIAASDVVVLSSIFEGLPKVAVQAVVAGKPVVATRVDGTPEIIRDGRNGYLVEPRAPAAFAEAMEKALVHRPTDPEDAERVEAWDQDRMVRAQEVLYTRLTAPRA